MSDLRGTLLYHSARSFKLHNALLELIDNSVDAGATIVSIRQDEGGTLEIIDNGHGFKDMVSAFILGKSNKTDSIGRYGIGMKDACLCYSKATEVESNGKKIHIPWEEIIAGFSSGESIPVNKIKKNGQTVLRLVGFDEKNNEKFNFNEIKRTYHPLIESGHLHLNHNGEPLKHLEIPEFTETLDLDLSYHGKRARISGGIYPPNAKNRTNWNGYNPYYKGRMIGGGKIHNAGTGDTGCTNFMFIIDLIDDEESWGLATNKDEVSKLTGFLDEVVFEHTRELLERGSEQATDIALKEIEQGVNLAISGNSGNITRAKRERSGEPKKESNTGSPKRNTNTANMGGDYVNGRGRGGNNIKFRFQDLGDNSIGDIKRQTGGYVVSANTNNPYIANNKTHETGVMFSKIAFAILRTMDGVLAPHDYTEQILKIAGEELAFTATQTQP